MLPWLVSFPVLPLLGQPRTSAHVSAPFTLIEKVSTFHINPTMHILNIMHTFYKPLIGLRYRGVQTKLQKWNSKRKTRHNKLSWLAEGIKGKSICYGFPFTNWNVYQAGLLGLKVSILLFVCPFLAYLYPFWLRKRFLMASLSIFFKYGEIIYTSYAFHKMSWPPELLARI